MNTERALEQVIEPFGDIDIKTREAVLKHNLVLCFCFLKKSKTLENEFPQDNA